MDLSRRDLLTASALLLAASKSTVSAAATQAASAVVPVAPNASSPIVLCWNENPYGPSPAARAVIGSTISQACRYPPDDEIDQLVATLAQAEKVPTDHIVLGTGSGELLCALGALHGHDGGEIVAAQPTYAELTAYARGAGANLKFVPLDKDLRHDLTAMHAAVPPKTRAVYVCNPNNPTGTAVSAATIRSFVNSLPESVTTIVDEAYIDFAEGGDVATVTDLVSSGKRVIVLRTFSKLHGMAGLRCGYGIARPDIVAEIVRVRMSTPNIFAMRAARASLADKAFLADTRQRIVASRSRIVAELARMGLRSAQSHTNFVFFDTGGPLARFAEFMKARQVLVGRLFPPYTNWCRISIGTEPEVEVFLQGLRSYARPG